jgi:Arc/MetJ family transcription regulator
MCTLGNNPRRIGKPTPHTSGGSDSNDPFIMNVYALCMTRTNVDIDDRLIADVMKRYHLPSKRRAIDYALRQLVITPMSRDDVLAMRGSGFDLTNDEIEGNWLVEE